MTDLVQIGRPSAAASTAFCAEKVYINSEEFLWVDGNGKVTASNGTLANPKPNAFSIVEIEDCPYRTPTCSASCYVGGIREHAPDTYAMYKHNSRTIRELLAFRYLWSEALAAHSAMHLAKWIRENCAGGFRWHVSGDLFSARYAEWVANVASEARVPQWIYTRSFPYLEHLHTVSTKQGGPLEINLSCDQDNYWLARRFHEQHGYRLCYLTVDGTVPDDLPPSSVVFPDYSLRGAAGLSPSTQRVTSKWFQSLGARERGMVCPVDFYGKSEKRRCGPCSKCLPEAMR